jgi:predicted GIY-YIG superfamily endonuclease
MQENTPSPLNPSWFVYLLRCADNTLYTGITTDLNRRLAEHNGENNSNKGARYTRIVGLYVWFIAKHSLTAPAPANANTPLNNSLAPPKSN